MNKSELIAAMDAHDAEGVRLEKAMTELGLDAKALKAIRKAEKAAEKARATLAELMGEPATVVEKPPETPPQKTDEEIAAEKQAADEAALAAQKKGGK
jgi:hypothetical protein